MSNIKLFTSNRLEVLAGELAKLLSKPLSSPLKSEAIVVQSKGMERWISMQLAERLGVWSNCLYYFPNQIIAEFFKQVIPGFSDERIFNKEIISWRIINILSENLDLKGFEELSGYLKDGNELFRHYQLSSRISDTFDQYLTYRPGMILDWDKGKGNSWQAKLWRLLVSKNPMQHPPALRNSFFEIMQNAANVNFDSLPERITVFGISSMPVYHMDILAAVSDYMEVNIFFMNPCREYWADIFTEKNIAGALERYEGNAASSELHLEKGNSLLASMGKLGGDFLSILMRNDIQEFPFFAVPEGDSLLCSIQSDILNMIDRGSAIGCERIEYTPDKINSDASIMIHSCHSAMREIEVLFDNILDIFNCDQEIEPRDIIVMMPDIEAYSPYISAVFGGHQNDEHNIPFSIADRSARKDSRTIDTFYSVLDLREGRFGAGEVMGILECGGIMSKFDLAADDLIIINRWIRETNINWGIDEEYRVKQGLPGFYENTWKAGIERLLLGYALTGRGEELYGHILPYDIEAGDSIVLGRFIEFYNSLTYVSKILEEDYTLSEWSGILKEILARLFTEKDSESLQEIRDALNALGELEEKAESHAVIDYRTIRIWLENFLSEKHIKTGFLTGGITFCAMLPMRSIPFKIVCLIGMNDNDFPSSQKAVSFDIIAQNPMRGDRSRRNDDRYLFLESIISARKKIYISYTGRRIQDNSEMPPSVAVSELIDYINQGYCVKGGNIIDYIFVEHPLQSFSPRYFGANKNLFSYSEINCRAGQAAAAERGEKMGFITGKLSGTYEINKNININDIIKFFTNPAAWLLKTRLGIYLDDRADIMEEREPFEIGGLEKYRLEDFLCEYYIGNRDVQNLYKIVRAKGLLPHGIIGEVTFSNIIPGIKDFSLRVKELTGNKKPGSAEISLDISGLSISGIVNNICENCMIQYRYADTKAKDRLSSWILHLVLNASGKLNLPLNGILVCKDASWEMEPAGDTGLLSGLLEIYARGNNELIYFFPESSLEYAKSILNKGLQKEALKSAEKKWTGNDYTAGEGSDPYYRLCFGDTAPFNKDFAEISLFVYESMLKNQKEK